MARPGTESTTKQLLASFQWNGGSSTEIRNSVASLRTYGGQITPGYFSLPSYALPINEYGLKLTKRSEQLIRRTQFYKWGPTPWLISNDTYSGIFGVSFPDYSYNIDHSELAHKQAIDNVIARVRDQKLNLAQAMAESQKTIDLVAGTAMKIAKALAAVKKGNIGAAQRALTGARKGGPKGSSVASNWLALQYGWKPLLNDVYGAVEHLAQNPKPPTFWVTGVGTASDSHQEYTHPGHGGGQVKVLELNYKSIARVKLCYQMANHTTHSMSQLGISNPAALAWELLPWSFVVDWFLPIGTYLNGVGYDNGLQFVTGVTIKFTRNDWKISMAGGAFSDANYNYTYSATDLLTSSNVLHHRIRLYSSPEPMLPKLKNPLSTDHLLNALALLRGVIR